MLIGLSAQQLIGCAYRLFSLGLYPGACVPALICQSARGLAKEAGLGGCADRGDGAQFFSKSTLFKFITIFSVRPANVRELCALSFKTLATPFCMRVLLTLATLSGAISGSAALLPVVASDFLSVNGAELLDPLDLVVEPQASGLQATLSPAEVKPVLAPPSPELPKPKLKVVPEVVKVITGEASWYGPGFYGNLTANGEVYKRGTMTAAHRTLPFGTKVRVTNLWNGRTAVIRINDRGPFIDHRVIDLGHGAASDLGLTASGIAQVKLEVLR